MVIPQHARGHGTRSVEDDLLVERGADRLRDPTLDLPAALLRIHHDAGIRGLHRLQDAHLAGLRVHGDPEGVHVERHRTAGAVLGAHTAKSGCPGALRQFGQRHEHRTAAQAAGFQGPRGGADLQVRLRGGRPQSVGKVVRRREHGLAGDDDARRAKRAGVVADRIRVGLQDLDPVGCGVQGRGGQLRVHRGGAVAELGRADPHGVGVARAERDRGLRVVPARWGGRDHSGGHSLAGLPVLAGRHGGVVAAGQCRLRQIEALVEAVAAEDEILALYMGDHERVVRANRVAPAQVERVDADSAGELVERGFDAEDHLAEAVTAEGARGEVVRIDAPGIHPLVGHPVEAHRFGAAVEHHPGAVVAVGAGVGEHTELESGEAAGVVGAEGDVDAHGVPARGEGELVGAAELVLHGSPGLQHGEGDDVLRQDLLLAAETAADPGREDAQPLRSEVEQAADLAVHQERHLRAGAQDEPVAVCRGVGFAGLQPADGRVRLQVGVRHSLGLPAAAHDVGGARQPGRDVTVFAVQLGHQVAGRVGKPARDGILVPVHQGSAGQESGVRVEDGGERFVVDLDQAAGGLGDGQGVGDDGRDALAVEPHHRIEHEGVVGVVEAVLVSGGGEQGGRGVGVGEHGVHPRQGGGRVGPDRADARVRLRALQHAEVQEAGHRDVEGVRLLPAHHAFAGGSSQGGADGAGAPPGLDDRAEAVDGGVGAADGVLDGAVAGASAQVALEQVGQVVQVVIGQGGGGHDHAGGAEPALEAGGVDEPLLDRGQVAGQAESGHGRDLCALGPERRVDAGVHRSAVDQHGAGAAVAGVAALLDFEVLLVANEGAQALPGGRRGVEGFSVDLQSHERSPRASSAAPGSAASSSARISSPSTPLMARRQSAAPCASVNQQSMAAMSWARESASGRES